MMNQRNPEITWTVSLDQANMILAIIGKRPYEEVVDVVTLLRYQASTQMQALQATQQHAPHMDSEVVPPAERIRPVA